MRYIVTKTNVIDPDITSAEWQRAEVDEITVNRWDKRAALHAMDLIEAFTEAVPFYHLACDISEQAVACLEQALEEGGYA